MPLKVLTTPDGELPFEASSAFCYAFGRHILLPEIIGSDEYRSGEPFHLLTIARRILNEYLTPEELRRTFISRDAHRVVAIERSCRWYARHLGFKTGAFVKDGVPNSGMVVRVLDDDADEVGLEADGDEEEDEIGQMHDGWLYAFTYPDFIRADGPFLIKVGKTVEDVEARVIGQCKGSAIPDAPKVIGSWQMKDISLAERTVHNLLKLARTHNEAAPGTEWFRTTISEIESAIAVVQQWSK